MESSSMKALAHILLLTLPISQQLSGAAKKTIPAPEQSISIHTKADGQPLTIIMHGIPTESDLFKALQAIKKKMETESQETVGTDVIEKLSSLRQSPSSS